MSENQTQGEEVFAPCRRGSDKLTTGQSCDGQRAIKEPSPTPHVVRFRCLKCGHAWAVPVGGTINL